jgi:hypothetical protein
MERREVAVPRLDGPTDAVHNAATAVTPAAFAYFDPTTFEEVDLRRVAGLRYTRRDRDRLRIGASRGTAGGSGALAAGSGA